MSSTCVLSSEPLVKVLALCCTEVAPAWLSPAPRSRPGPPGCARASAALLVTGWPATCAPTLSGGGAGAGCGSTSSEAGRRMAASCTPGTCARSGNGAGGADRNGAESVPGCATAAAAPTIDASAMSTSPQGGALAANAAEPACAPDSGAAWAIAPSAGGRNMGAEAAA